MKKRVESATSALSYFNKLVAMLVGRGYSYEAAVQTAVAALAKRYAHFGVMMAGHLIVREILAKHNINPIATATYISFANAYLKRIQEGHVQEAEALVKVWTDKGADPNIIKEIVDWLGRIEAEGKTEVR